MPAQVVNGSRTKGAKRQAIINALAFGHSQRAICLKYHVSPRVVTAIEAQEFQTLQARKERLANQAEIGALLAGDRLIQAIEAGHIKGGALAAPYGIFVDKALALRGDGIQRIEHTHTHKLTGDDILSFAVQRSKQLKQAKARTVEPLQIEGSEATATPRARLASDQASNQVRPSTRQSVKRTRAKSARSEDQPPSAAGPRKKSGPTA